MVDVNEEKCFRQLEDVGCPAEIAAMKWSPMMDLIAIITIEGAVWLNRLSWQRVWTLRSPDYKAISLAWRPDGKVIALGLDNGKVHLVNIENSECLHEYEVGGKPEFLNWVSTPPPRAVRHTPIFTEKGNKFLPPLPHLPTSGSTTLTKGKTRDGPWDPKRLNELTDSLSFLVIADEHSVVTLLVYGLLPIGRVNVVNLNKPTQKCRILGASLDARIQFVTIVTQSSELLDFSDSVVSIVTYDTMLYSSRSEELGVLSMKYGQISSILSYFDATFQAMSEAWEDILLEIDSQLEKYAESLAPSTSVSEEFLTLFTCGTASPELQMFLVNDLTVKGLKKLGKAVESSYLNIQTLAMKNLQTASNALLFHLNDLMGMAKWNEHFGILGLSHTMVTECLNILGSLMLKTQELLSVIENALQSFIAFFKWLYLVILQLLEEEVPGFVKCTNQDDVSLVAEFLHYQLGQRDKGKTRFSMERVGQYLKKEPLVFKVNNSENVWQKFLETCPELCNSSCIFKVDPEKSLVTLYDELTSSIKQTFQKLIHTTEQALSCNLQIPLVPCISEMKAKVCLFSKEDASPYNWIAIQDVSERFHLVRLSKHEGVLEAEGATVGFYEVDMNDDERPRISVVDFRFYDETTLTILLRRHGGDDDMEDLLMQYKFSTLDDSQFKHLTRSRDQNYDTIVTSLANCCIKSFQSRGLARMKALKLAVSGSRKVSCVLSTSRTRVKLFDMNADEEEPDDTIDDLQSSAMSTDSAV